MKKQTKLFLKNHPSDIQYVLREGSGFYSWRINIGYLWRRRRLIKWDSVGDVDWKIDEELFLDIVINYVQALYVDKIWLHCENKLLSI